MSSRIPLLVEVSPLIEEHYTGIPNVVREICTRLLDEDGLDLRFEARGRWVDHATLRRCLDEWSGRSLGPRFPELRPAADIRSDLDASGALGRSVALYTALRPTRKVFARETMLVYDLSMLLAPECHPASSVELYTRGLGRQIACCDLVFCISDSTARDVAWIFGVPAERLRVALLGSNVDLTHAERVRAMIGERPVEPFLLVLGSIEPRKNTGLVLEWLSRHPEMLDRYRIVFAGRQAWGETFAAQIEARSMQGAVAAGRIVYMSYVDERLKAALLAGASALLYPSIFEGFGLPLLEAMAVGTPVLASVSTSMPEVVGDCGYDFDPCDVASLHAALGRLEADRRAGTLAGKVARARRRATQFSYDTTYRVIRDGLFPGA